MLSAEDAAICQILVLNNLLFHSSFKKDVTAIPNANRMSNSKVNLFMNSFQS